MRKILLFLAFAISVSVVAQNTAPVVSDIPDQSLGACGTFATINLDSYVSDAETAVESISWSFNGNSALSVTITDRVATITTPASNWYGSETITFTATDDDATDPLSDSDAASFTLAQMGIPSLGTITQPNCTTPTGSVQLTGLPSTGTWTLTRYPGAATSNGTGTSTTISGLTDGSYTWTVTSSTGCLSESSASAVINAAPPIPTAPSVGGITQPNCTVSTGSVDFTGLPASGSWTLTASPGGATTVGSGTTTTISGLAPDTYTYTVTNSDGCVSPASGSVVINAAPPIPTAPSVGGITQPNCTVSTGSVDFTGLPASGSWTLTANPGGATTVGSGTTTTISGLAPDTYTYTVTNSDGCVSPASGSVVINAAPPIPTAPSVGGITQPNCTVSTGSVDFTGLPASGSWTLTASPGGATTVGSGTTTTISGLAPDTYTYTVTNSDGCVSPASGSIVINPAPLVPSAPIVGAITQPTCAVSTGSVDFTGLPASGSWTLTASPGGATTVGSGTTTTISGLAPDTYTYTVTNSDGCVSPASGSVVINPSLVVPVAPTVGAITQPTCSVTTGRVVLSDLPATGTWTITASPGGATRTSVGTSTTFTGLTAGTYTFTVTNSDGCVSTSSGSVLINASLEVPTAPIVGAITQPSCALSTGSVDLSGLPASGSWTITATPGGATTNGTGTTTTLSGLSSDTYTYTVTNSDGCESSASGSVLINPALVVPSSPLVGAITHPSCAISTGSVDLSGLPATGTWTLTVSPGGGTTNGTGTITTLSGLASGSYTYTVTNSDGCVSPASGSIVINPAPLVPSAPLVGAITQPTCGVSTGSVNLSGLPATGSWTLTASPGGATTNGSGTITTISSLASGTYTYTVTNDDGCVSLASGALVINAALVVPTAPSVGAITQPTCSVTTGRVVLSDLPATGTWTITASPGGATRSGVGSSTTFTGLSTGTYTFTVTNSDGCVSTSSGSAVINAALEVPTAPLVGAITQPSCGVTTGSVDLSGLPASGTWTLTESPGGGTSNGSGTTTTLSGLASGSYTYTVTNSDGCESPSSGTIVVNPTLEVPTVPIVGTITQPGCGVSTGSVDLSGLPASGSWTLTVSPGGGTTNGSGTTTTISGLLPGGYTYTVTNSDGCVSPATGSIGINPALIVPDAPIVGAITQPSCGVSTGSVNLSGLPATGGWTLTASPGGATTNGSGSSTTISGLVSDTYTYTVTNDDGCVSLASGPVVINPSLVVPVAPTVGAITQPTCSVTTGRVVLSDLPATGTWTITASPGGATRTSVGTSTTFTGLSTGTYTFTVTNSDGCVSSSSGPATINAPLEVPTAPIVGSITQPSCGITTGSVDLSGLPATGTWTLTVSPGGGTTNGTGTSTTLSGLASGTYTYTVTNGDGCESPASGPVVINPALVVPSAPNVGAITQPICGLPTGSVDLSGLPASGTWTLTVSPGGGTTNGTGTSTTLSGLTSGSYTYTVTNSDGCESPASGPVVINPALVVPNAPIVGAITQPICGVPSGSVNLSGLPASGNWTLTASPGGATTNGTGSSTTISGLTSGSYTYTVTNSDGCVSPASGSAVINPALIVPTAPLVGSISQPICGVPTGSVDLSGLPASGTWTLTASPGGATTNGTGISTTLSGLAPGTYTYTVTNDDGCVSLASGPLVINPALVVPDAPIVGAITQPSCGVATGAVNLSGLPATGTWTLTVSPGGSTTNGTGTGTTISALASGSYTYTVTNDDGCVSLASGAVVINPALVVPTAPTVGAITQPTCSVTTGRVVLGDLPATGTWTITASPGGATRTSVGTSTTFTGLTSGTYTFTVTNSDGCLSISSGPAVINAPLEVPTAPIVGAITHPTCGVITGSVDLSGLPSSGTWTLTVSPGGSTTNGTGTSTTISSLAPGTHSYTVTNSDGCVSTSSGPVVINPALIVPAAPIVGTITQPTCAVATGSVVLNGLPSSGTWTLTRYPGGATSTGSGSSTTISGLSSRSYTYTVTNADGCVSVVSNSIVIDAQPVTPDAPTIGTIAQPTCSVPTGSVILIGLPASGTWTLTRSPGGATINGSGTSRTISGLSPGSYTYTVTNDLGCTSAVSATVTINLQPVTPGAPVPGTITQPTCSVASGSVVLNDLPSSGSWTLTRIPGGATTSGSGGSRTISGLTPGSYRWTVQNSDGCTSVTTSSVTINLQPVTPDAPDVGTITHPTCGVSTGSVVLYDLPASGAWTLTRSPGGNTTNGSGTGITISGLSAGSYTYTVRNDDGCTSSSSAAVVINSQPVTPNAPTSGSITQPTCSVGSGSFNLYNLPSSGSWTLTRYPGGITSSGSGTSVNISGLEPDAYTFTVTNSVGCTSPLSNSVVINLQPVTPTAPVVGTISQPTCYSPNGSVVLSGLPEFGNWTLERSPGGNTTNGSGTVRSLSGIAPGSYTFIVRNDQGCPSGSSAIVGINPQPSTPTSSISLGDSYTSCQGETVVLDAGSGFDSYSWSNGPSSQTTSVTANGTYTVTVSEGDCSASADADVTFNPIPSLELGSTKYSCVGGSVLLNAGSGFDSYRWTTGANSQSISVSQNGSYGVTITQDNCSNTDNVQVVFNSLPQIPLETSYYGTSCINLDAGNSGSTYQWNTGASTQTLSACSTGTYSVIVTNPNNCSASKETLVTIGEKPVVNLPASLSGCEGESITLDAGSGFASYQWSNGASTQSIQVTSTGTYSVTVRDSYNEEATDNCQVTFFSVPSVDLGDNRSICQSESIDLSAGLGFVTYEWSTGESTESISITRPGDYSVTVNDGNCSASDQVSVEVKDMPTVELGEDVSSCVGDTVALDAGTGYESYAWSTGETSSSIKVSEPGTYSVSVTNNGCSVIDGLSVSFNELPEVELGTPVTACDGDEVTLNAGLGFSAYLWSTGESTQSIVVTNSDSYSVTVSNGNCDASDEVDVIFHDSPRPELGPAVVSCEGEFPILDAGAGFENYLWNTGGTGQSITVTSGGTYTVVVSDGTCPGSDSVSVDFLQVPVVDLGPSITPCEGDVVILDAGPGYDIYLWSTGETTQTIQATITREYLVSVNNMCGSTSDGVLVTFKDSPKVDLGDDVSIDVGAELVLDAGSGQKSYLWSTGSRQSQITVSRATDGKNTYWVEVTGNNDCQASDTIVVAFGTGVGIIESAQGMNISVYPNPTEDYFLIRSDRDIYSDIVFTIYDAAGKILLQKKWGELVSNQPRSLDISDFKPGMYLIQFYSGDKVAHRKIIKH